MNASLSTALESALPTVASYTNRWVTVTSSITVARDSFVHVAIVRICGAARREATRWYLDGSCDTPYRLPDLKPSPIRELASPSAPVYCKCVCAARIISLAMWQQPLATALIVKFSDAAHALHGAIGSQNNAGLITGGWPTGLVSVISTPVQPTIAMNGTFAVWGVFGLPIGTEGDSRLIEISKPIRQKFAGPTALTPQANSLPLARTAGQDNIYPTTRRKCSSMGGCTVPKLPAWTCLATCVPTTVPQGYMGPSHSSPTNASYNFSSSSQSLLCDTDCEQCSSHCNTTDSVFKLRCGARRVPHCLAGSRTC